MQVTETLSEGLKRAYAVVVPAADIEDRRASRLSELAKQVNLPGFRPGKVPMPIVRQRFGGAVEVAFETALTRIRARAWLTAVVIVLVTQMAAAKARRHDRLGDPNPTSWSDVFRP